jgi:hypothetical protein
LPVVILAIVAGTAIVARLIFTGGHQPTRPDAGTLASPSGPALGSFTLVYTGEHGVKIVPLNGHRPLLPLTTETGPPVPTSAGVAFVHNGTAYLLAPPYDTPPRPLIAADGLFPMIAPDMVGAEVGNGSGSRSAMYIDLKSATSARSPRWQFPAGYQPVGQFFAEGPGGLLIGWTPGSGGRVDLGPVVGHAAAVLGTVGSRVVWLAAGGCGSNHECPLHISTSDYPHDVDEIVPPPPGHAGFLPGGAVAANGTVIAAFVATSRAHAELAIVDAVLDTTVVPGSSIAISHGSATAQWTPDASYVLFAGPGSAMHVYAPGSTRAVGLDIKGSSSFSVG